jgi:hypothetical protein
MVVPVTHQVAHGRGHKGSRRLRTSVEEPEKPHGGPGASPQLPSCRAYLGAGLGAVKEEERRAFWPYATPNKRDLNFDLNSTNQKVGGSTPLGRATFRNVLRVHTSKSRNGAALHWIHG